MQLVRKGHLTKLWRLAYTRGWGAGFAAGYAKALAEAQR